MLHGIDAVLDETRKLGIAKFENCGVEVYSSELVDCLVSSLSFGHLRSLLPLSTFVEPQKVRLELLRCGTISEPSKYHSGSCSPYSESPRLHRFRFENIQDLTHGKDFLE